jgi:adenine-specific DNA glycosylase
MRADDTAVGRSSELNADLGGLSAPIPELRQGLLAWWELHGRHTIPWKRGADGGRPSAGEELAPYPVLVAEVMRAAGQHGCSFEG